jgi:nucleoside-diphosphate-sugar epimerase
VGAALVAALRADGVAVRALGRGDPVPGDGDLGHVAYCAGLTTDAAQRPLDALDAHVGDLVALLRRGGFRSLTYLSSTRVYAGAEAGREDAVLRARPQDLFAVSKLAGEAACLSVDRPGVRVVRLSTVYGGSFDSPNFLCALLRAMRAHATLTLTADPATARDYVHVDDVVEAFVRATDAGTRRYNIGTGIQTSVRELHSLVADATGAPDDPVMAEARPGELQAIALDCTRAKSELDWSPAHELRSGIGDTVAWIRRSLA